MKESIPRSQHIVRTQEELFSDFMHKPLIRRSEITLVPPDPFANEWGNSKYSYDQPLTPDYYHKESERWATPSPASIKRGVGQYAGIFYNAEAYTSITKNKSLLPQYEGGSYILGKVDSNYHQLSAEACELFRWIKGEHGEIDWLKQIAKINGFSFDKAFSEIQALGILEVNPDASNSVQIMRRRLG